MRAIGYQHTGSIDRPDALLDIELPYPIASGHDVLVEVKAVSVNPVDTKMRSRRPAKPGEYEVWVTMPQVSCKQWEQTSRDSR